VPDKDYDEIEALLRGERAEDIGELRSAVRQAGRSIDNARWWIGIITAGVYGTVVIFIVGYLIWRGVSFGEDVFDKLMDVVKIALLPILASVLTYYFTSRSR
jgi:hypothetical protein